MSEVKAITLTITMDQAGNVQVEGAIHNLYLAYAALEMAKDALRRWHAERNEQRVQIADALTLPADPKNPWKPS